jgi:signal transduction histidine kinase
MRSLFKRAPPLKQLLDLNETIREVCDLIADDARTRGIQVQTALQLDLPRVRADRVHIQQVIANIARNAMEAVESVARPKELAIASRSTPEEVVVSIIDNGEGVSESDLLFEPLYTTKPNGMGMGLAICRSIIEAHGGRLWVQRNPSHGATFSFALVSSAARA